MRTRGHALRLLTAAFQGRLPGDAEWLAVIDMANRGWLGPALYVALKRMSRLDEVPQSVRDYLGLLHERNHHRNHCLRRQLIEAVGALNTAGIRPTLLKGAIHLFSAPDACLGSRMISDLDISITPSEGPAARAALKARGYEELAAKELARAGDAGVVELHDRPSLRSAAYLRGDLRTTSRVVEEEGVVAFVPCSTSRALHLIVHDMIKEGDYRRLRLDLRHLHDLAELAGSSEGVDWRQIGIVLSDRDARGALKLQAMALRDLFGIPVPPDLCGDSMTRLKHRARTIATSRSAAGACVRLVGNLAWGLDRFATIYTWRGARDLSKRTYRVLVSPTKGSRL